MSYKLPENLTPKTKCGHAVCFDKEQLKMTTTRLVKDIRQEMVQMIDALGERGFRVIHIDGTGVYCEIVTMEAGAEIR